MRDWFEIEDELKKKLNAEQSEYKSELLAKGAAAVMDNAFNIAMRDEIMHI